MQRGRCAFSQTHQRPEHRKAREHQTHFQKRREWKQRRGPTRSPIQHPANRFVRARLVSGRGRFSNWWFSQLL
jgi:hypothetical protein